MSYRTLLAAVLLAAPPVLGQEPSDLVQPWLNAELVAWDDDVLKHHRLAQALGYDAVADAVPDDRAGGSLATAETSRGLGFYLNDPHKKHQPPMGFDLPAAELADAQKKYPYTFLKFPELPRAIDTRELDAMRRESPALFAKVKDAFEKTKAWSHKNAEFPKNLAELQQWGDGNRWEPAPDFQQQAVIDAHVDAIVAYAAATDDNDFDYKFVGVVIDVIEIWREFDWSSDRPLPGPSALERRAVEHDGVTHDFPTYRAGWYAFLAQLRDRLEREFPGRPVRYVWEPTPIAEAWVKPLNQADFLDGETKRKIMGDALLDEKPGLRYLTDPQVLDLWPPHRLGTASGDLFTKDPHYPTHLTYLGEISSRGGYFLSYGTFDRSRRDVDTYANQFKLIRALSGWQNQAATPIETRMWDASQQVYHSPTAHADAHALAGLHPKNGHVYAVLLDADAAIHLAEGVTAGRLRDANAFFEPVDRAPAAEVVDGVLRPTSGASFPVSVIAEIDRPDGGDVFALPPGVTLAQDRSVVSMPNTELLNPSFEGGLDGWFGTGNARLVLIENAADGAKAVRVENRAQMWHALSQRITGVLMNFRQGRYRMAAKVRPLGGDGTFTLGYRFNERGQDTADRTGPIAAPADAWTPIEAEFTLSWGDWIEEGRLLIVRTDGTQPYLVDDVSIEFLGR